LHRKLLDDWKQIQQKTCEACSMAAIWYSKMMIFQKDKFVFVMDAEADMQPATARTSF
jgi:hypothetical protein